MKTTDVQKNRSNNHEQSLKGALFSTIVFVGGGLVAFMLLLFAFYMMRF